ncbi:AraC family transcriptional regulator [Paenibacillus sp. 1P03SA]|uniref:AraC family transcriptional regulator n=1 Tax=Paenibacillus sp. 1P03SA TaxID=3132294 RepID=UPI0039A2CD95
MLKPFHSVSVNPYNGKGELFVLFAGHGQTAPRHEVGPQMLDYYLIHTVESGKGRFSCLGKEYELGPGDTFVIFPGEVVTYASDTREPWRYRWIGFKGSSADDLLIRLGITAQRPVVHAAGLSRLPVFLRRAERALREAGPACDLEAEGELRLLLGKLAAHADVPRRRGEETDAGRQQVDRAVRWLQLQYAQPVTIEQLAQHMGYHRTYLSKLFRQHTGLTPTQFLLKIRMERAKLLMTEGSTIEQIAYSVGFSDPLYFSKQFKKWFGCTPSEYRTKHGRLAYDCSR